LDPITAFVDGIMSAVGGYAIAAIVPAFLTVFYALHSPWYVPALFIVFVIAAVIGEIVNGVTGSFGYAAGFLYGAYSVQDWIALVGVAILSAILLYFRLSSNY
jgi:hypothetical protein